MPDREAPTSLSYNTFTAGEVAPGIYGRQDLQKYKAGCATMFNWYVDARGGATIRPGSQFIGHPGHTGYARLIPFHFSPEVGQTYLLVFTNHLIEIVKNPGTAHYPNSSNSGFMGGVTVTTPYVTADLQKIRYIQIADIMWLTCRGYPRKKLFRFSDTSWVLDDVPDVPAISYPVIQSGNVSTIGAGLAAQPSETRYGYRVSAVNTNGAEGWASIPFIVGPGINIGATQGSVTISWTDVANAAFYKVYKCLPAHGNRVPPNHESFGFAGFSYGTTFVDSNIVPDFVHCPVSPGNPFNPGQIIGINITNPGSGYPVGGTGLNITDSTGFDGLVLPVMDNNVGGGTGGIVGIWIWSPGRNYTAPTITAVGGGTGFAATLMLSPNTGIDPYVVGLLQQRMVYATTDTKPNTLFASRPGSPDDFRKSNPVSDSDSFEFGIFDQQVTQINWLRTMPGGLLVGTDAAVIQLTGGKGSPSDPVAITPTNAVIVPQSFFGTAADIQPIVIDYNVLFVQREGGVVRDLQYNFFVNIYVGTDVTVMSNHMFTGKRIVDWAYQDMPNKIVWVIDDNGNLMSLTYLKAQEVTGWARHLTNGLVESICMVHEGDINAIYMSVLRNGARCIERQTQQVLYQDSDAWQLDSALSTPPSLRLADLTLAAEDGREVLATASADVFEPEDVGATLYGLTGRATIIQYVSPAQVVLDVDVERPFFYTSIQQGNWEVTPLISSFSGLNHLEGMQVYALVDGAAQGPFTVSGGSVTLTTPGSRVVCGLNFTAILQPLYLDVGGEQTIQGKRKKIAAASVRVNNSKGLLYGPDFNNLILWTDGTSSTDPHQSLPYQATGLFSGDQRIWLDQQFSVGGWIVIQQNLPYPATVLSIYPEAAQGDAM